MTRHALLFATIAAATAFALACGQSSLSDSGDGDAGDDGSIALPPDDTSKTPPGPAGTGLATGLPCDVQAVLENRCLACHDGNTVGATRMLSYDDLMVDSKFDPGKTLAQASLERMQSTSSPMPPPPAVPPEADEIATFAAWVNAGTPKNPTACTTAPPGAVDGGFVDSGTSGDGGTTALVCTSGTKWTLGDQGSPLMHPGAACNACHQVKGGPNLRFAGTVYPTLHEPNDCNGKAPPPTLTVTVTDKNGKTAVMTVNAAGNFDTQQKGLQPPYRAQVSDGAKVRKMNGTVTSGDCNSCHTPTGANGAPGRIQAP